MRWLQRGALSVLVLLVLAAGALGALVRSEAAQDDARQEAVAAAEQAAVAVLSYDHRTLEDDVAAAREQATGTFLEQYTAATDGLVEQAEQSRAVVAAAVQATSVQSVDDDRVVLLLFVDQTTVRAGQQEPRLDQNRVRLTMQRVDGRWLVAELDAL